MIENKEEVIDEKELFNLIISLKKFSRKFIFQTDLLIIEAIKRQSFLKKLYCKISDCKS